MVTSSPLPPPAGASPFAPPVGPPMSAVVDVAPNPVVPPAGDEGAATA
jgi:hypothetical protein